MKKIIVLAFDIPVDKPSFRVKMWRELKGLGVRKKLRSHCILPFSKRNLSDLKMIGKKIKKGGGKAEIIIGTRVM